MEAILSSASRAQSPVDGEGAFDPLSPKYKKKKTADGLPGKANLEYSGDLLNDLTFEETDEGIELGWFGVQAGKADGHNNLSGDSSLPQRRVLPDVGQSFIDHIQAGAEKIIGDAISDSMDFKKADFVDVETKADLYRVLDEFFPDFSRAETRAIVARSADLLVLLDELDLLDLL